MSRCIVDSFHLGENSEAEAGDEPRAKRAKTDKERKVKKKYGPIWMVLHLVMHLKFLQPKILKLTAYELERQHLLQSLYNQVSMFLCFTSEEKSSNYEDPTARNNKLDALKLRFSLIGGLFESIIHTQNSIGDWSTLLVQSGRDPYQQHVPVHNDPGHAQPPHPLNSDQGEGVWE